MNEIERCPFCDKNVAETSNCKELEGCGHIEGCPATGPYVCVVCNMHEGGCGASSGYYDSEAKAIAAWNRRTEPENNPLTLDELRQMDGEVVWIVQGNEANPEETESMWGELYREERGYIWFFLFGVEDDYGLLTEHYGNTWRAYRHKPERSEG
jgi:hypothetical protein